MNNGKPPVSPAAIEALMEAATVLSESHGDLIADAVREARDHPLDEERARHLYTRILTILNEHAANEMTEAERVALADDIRRQVDEIVGSVERPPAEQRVEFVVHNGLHPRDVQPLPTFNDRTIVMTEGYVEVEKLQLWPENHRLELVVAEFQDHNHRPPEPHELVLLMHGSISLPNLKGSDPFGLRPLADSIARKGVETPPVITYDGVPMDGNRRIAASLLVLRSREYSDAEKERARYIKVWRTPPNPTPDQINAIVVSRNFESDHKAEWPEYIKGRLVVQDYERRLRQLKNPNQSDRKRTREAVAKAFAIKPARVERYVKMVRWADDFAAFHEDRGEDPAKVRYTTEKNFQWFYELDAGRGNEKLTAQLDQDDVLKEIVYDLMFNVLDSGAQVRDLHYVVANPDTAATLREAHDVARHNKDEAMGMVEQAIIAAKRDNIVRRSIDFESYLKTMVDRLGSTAPDQWNSVNSGLLLEVRRVMQSALGAIEGQTTVRLAQGENLDR